MTGSIVLEPGVRFATIAAAFSDWDGGPTDRHAWLAGEPIGAHWTRGGEEVRYSANPAIGLRVLSGSGAAAAAGTLPALGADRVRALARSDDLGAALLGVTAAGLRGDLAAVDDLEALVDDPRPEVRAAAAVALRRLGAELLHVGAERLAERRRQAPDRDPVLGLPRSAATRRQLIRQLAADPPEDPRRRLELVRAALHDDDWEVRWSGVIAAHDLELPELLADIKRCRPAERAHRVDREILAALRDVVGCGLAGMDSSHPGAGHLRACLGGAPAPRDRAWALIGALRRPLPTAAPDAAPPGFCAVPAVLHWLGDPEVEGSPVRSVVPERSFAVAADVHGQVAAADVPAALAALSVRLGVPLRLPAAAELEMAVRGPDGRRYPWGNGRERRAGAARSPWGLRHPLDRPEWVEHADSVMALGAAVTGCAGPLQRPEIAGLRTVVSGWRAR